MRKDKYCEVDLEAIAKCRAKKTKRRKARKAKNARLREAGLKFSKKDNCYRGK